MTLPDWPYICPNCGHVNTYANDIADRHCVVCKQYEAGPIVQAVLARYRAQRGSSDG